MGIGIEMGAVTRRVAYEEGVLDYIHMFCTRSPRALRLALAPTGNDSDRPRPKTPAPRPWPLSADVDHIAQIADARVSFIPSFLRSFPRPFDAIM